jgi:predicted RNase H-like nuclease
LASEEKSCSKQAAAILPKVREVDRLMTPARQLRIREGHPELSFAVMNGGVPLQFNKRCVEGQSERIALLRRHFSGLALPRSGMAGDMVDALAMLWSAERVAEGIHLTLPARPELDDYGIRAEIVG